MCGFFGDAPKNKGLSLYDDSFGVSGSYNLNVKTVSHINVGYSSTESVGTSKTLSYFVENHYRDYIETHHKQKATSFLYIGYFIAAWSHKNLEDINIKDLEDYRKKRLRQGRSPSTINREMNLLQGLFSKAIEWDVIKETPFRKLKPLKVNKKGITRYLSIHEERALREALRSRDAQKRNKREQSNEWHIQRKYKIHVPSYNNYSYVDYLEPAVLLALNTGMRKGELLSLCWRDIDLNQRMLNIKGENTKSSQSRNIPLNEEAYSVMLTWKNERFTKNDDYIFTNPATGEKLNDIKKAWQEVLKQANIENFRFHDLRHTFASKLAMRNIDLYSIKELLGHSRLEMVQRYAHLSQDYLKKALSTLDNQE